MKKLYHYCSTEAFRSIVESKKLWLTHCDHTNDADERKYVWDYIKKKLDAIKKEKLKGIEDSEKAIFVNTIEAHYLLNDTLSPFIFALSENADLLSQWRGYGDNGQGVCFGIISTHMGIKECVPDLSIHPEDTVGICPVVYDSMDIQDIVNTIIDKHLEFFKDDADKARSPSMMHCTAFLQRFAKIAKNPGFSEEKEWRIIYRPIMQLRQNKVIGQYDALKYRIIKNGILSPYFELPIDDKVIVELIIGPRNETSVDIFDTFLKWNNYNNVRVYRSSIPYV